MKPYEFIDRDEYETDEDNGLQRLLDECEFIVTEYGTMYPSEGCEVMLLRNWVISSPTGGYDSFYNVKGGYKLETKQ